MLQGKTLSVDCSVPDASLALFANGQELAYRQMEGKLRQGGLLVPMVGEMLEAHDLKVTDLDNMVLNVGPGSFTGLRMAVVMTQSFCHVHGNLAIYAVPFEETARPCFKEYKGDCLSASLLMDAQGGQIFRQDCERVKDGEWKLRGELRREDAEALIQDTSPRLILGVLPKLRTQLEWPGQWQWLEADFPNARWVYRAACDEMRIAVRELDVRYMGPSSAEVNWKKRNSPS